MFPIHKISLAILVTFTIPLFIRPRSIGYYWLMLRKKYFGSKPTNNKKPKNNLLISDGN